MPTNKPHTHAKSMLLYAQDAMETNEPWERWECSDNQEDWVDFITHPVWLHALYYRRKPSTILINGIEVPEPVKQELSEGQSYYLVDITYPEFMQLQYWNNDSLDTRFLGRGLIHLT